MAWSKWRGACVLTLMATVSTFGLAWSQSPVLNRSAPSLPEQGRIMTVHEKDRKSTRLNSSHIQKSRMPSSA